MKSFIKFSAIALASALAVSTVSASGSSYSAPAKTAKVQELKLQKVQVQLIQYALKDLGHNPGAIDGQWGNASSNAVRLYQASVGKTQTGALDVNTACYLLNVGIANHGSSAQMPSWCGFN